MRGNHLSASPPTRPSRGAPQQMGGGSAVVGAARPLLVPAADVTAKNLRAAQHPHGTLTSYEAGRGVQKAVSLLDSLAPTPRNGQAGGPASGPPKFSKLEDDTPALLTRLRAFFQSFSASRTRTPRRSRSSAGNPVLRGLARAADALDVLPNPSTFFLAQLALLLLLRALRPAILDRLGVRLVLRASLSVTVLLGVLWRRGAPLRNLAAGHGPFFHPVDACLDAYADALDVRERAARDGEEELRQNRSKLDALRRELARDPAAATPRAVIVPSRRAAAMIAAGALGAGYDPEKAAEAERIRKEESVARSRAQWRERAERAAESRETAESIQMRSHAATGYRKHTKELKMRAVPVVPRSGGLSALRKVANTAHSQTSSPGGGGSVPGTPVFGSFTSLGNGAGPMHANGAAAIADGSDEAPRRLSDASDASGMSTASAPAGAVRDGAKKKRKRLRLGAISRLGSGRKVS